MCELPDVASGVRPETKPVDVKKNKLCTKCFEKRVFDCMLQLLNTPNTVIWRHPTPVNVIINLFDYHFLFVAIQEVQQQRRVCIAAAQGPLNSSSTESSATEMKVAFQTA